MGLQVQTAVKNGQRFVKHRVMRAAAAFRSQFRPPVGAIDYKRFEETKTFQTLKEMGEKRGIKVSMNPRSACRKDYLCVSTQTILCLEHDYTAEKINGVDLLRKIRHILDDYDKVKILDKAKMEFIGTNKVI